MCRALRLFAQTLPLCAGLFAPVEFVAAQSPERTRLADGIYLIRTPFDGYVRGNSVVIVNDADVTVFDSNTRPSTAASVIAEIRQITDKPVRTVINSHWHPDHWSGNEVYAREFPGVQFIATQGTREVMANVAAAWPSVFAGNLARRRAALDTLIAAGHLADGSPLTPELRRAREAELAAYGEFVSEMAGVKRILPTMTYVDSLTLYNGQREMRLVSLTGDADASTVVYLPREKVLLTGDLLVHPVQWTTQSYRISPWIASLRALSALDVDVIVPGHGPAFRDKSYMLDVMDLFESARMQVRAALERGEVTVAEVQRAVNLDANRAKLARGDAAVEEALRATVASLVQKLYLEARGGMESRR